MPVFGAKTQPAPPPKPPPATGKKRLQLSTPLPRQLATPPEDSGEDDEEDATPALKAAPAVVTTTSESQVYSAINKDGEKCFGRMIPTDKFLPTKAHDALDKAFSYFIKFDNGSTYICKWNGSKWTQSFVTSLEAIKPPPGAPQGQPRKPFVEDGEIHERAANVRNYVKRASAATKIQAQARRKHAAKKVQEKRKQLAQEKHVKIALSRYIKRRRARKNVLAQGGSVTHDATAQDVADLVAGTPELNAIILDFTDEDSGSQIVPFVAKASPAEQITRIETATEAIEQADPEALTLFIPGTETTYKKAIEARVKSLREEIYEEQKEDAKEGSDEGLFDNLVSRFERVFNNSELRKIPPQNPTGGKRIKSGPKKKVGG